MPASQMFASLADASTTVRLSLHVLAAAIWLGGQFTLAGLLPTVRSLGPDAPKRIARAFARLAWPAFLVLVGTGIWNVAASESSNDTTAWHAVLGVKIAVVVVAGVATLVHQRATKRSLIGASGAIGSLCSLAALVLGVVLAG